MKKTLFISSFIPFLLLSSCVPNESSKAYVGESSNTTVIFSKGVNTSGGTDSIVATYGQDMPAISVPRKSGSTFYGYYDAPEGMNGTKYYTSSGKSAHVWDKRVSSYHLYAYWSGSGSNNGGNNGNNGGNTNGQTYTGYAIKNISEISFEVTQFGVGTGYFVGGIMLKSGYSATTSISCTITVTVSIYYSAFNSGNPLSYTDEKRVSMSMTIPSGGTSATGRCSVTWQTTISKANGSYRATNETYSYNVSSISGTAKAK